MELINITTFRRMCIYGSRASARYTMALVVIMKALVFPTLVMISKLTGAYVCDASSNPTRSLTNCYNSASAQDLRDVVTECDTHRAVVHPLYCADFYNKVVFQNQCSTCPRGQYKLPNNTADNPCVCGYTAGPLSSGPPSLFGPVPGPLPGEGSSVQVGAVVGGNVGLFAAFCIIVGLVIWECRRQFSTLDRFKPAKQGEGKVLFYHGDKQQVKTGWGQENETFGLGCADLGDWDPPQGFQRFTLAELARITDNFNDSKVLGAGGFGKVFLGTLEDGRMVAVKRPSPNSVQGLGEFRNEVELLSRLHHRHLVRLEGFCQEEGLEILVYEYMIKRQPSCPFTWKGYHGTPALVYKAEDCCWCCTRLGVLPLLRRSASYS